MQFEFSFQMNNRLFDCQQLTQIAEVAVETVGEVQSKGKRY